MAGEGDRLLAVVCSPDSHLASRSRGVTANANGPIFSAGRKDDPDNIKTY